LKKDYLIVGQGLVGTLLAHSLLQKGKSIHFFDNHHKGSSSVVAAGIINPVTGRRVVKSWLIDDLIPFAKKTYQSIEDKFGIKTFHEKNIVRVLFSIKEENLWLEKTSDPLVENYILDNQDLGKFKNQIEEGTSIGEVTKTAQVNLNALLKNSKAYFKNNELISFEEFDYQKVTLNDGFVFYKNLKAQKIIFCEGQQGRKNPWFNHLPFEVAKGEVLLVKIEKVDFDKILKHKLFIVPKGNDIYWIGSTYDWDSINDLPTEEAKQLLIFKLKKILKVPFKVLDHQAAIRPTTFDRRPFIGFHSEFPQLGIINGMGTKGASLI